MILLEHTEVVTGVSWFGDVIYSSSLDRTLRETIPEDGTSRILLQGPRSFRRLALSPDGSRLALFSGEDTLIFLTRSETGWEETNRQIIRKGLICLSWSPDSRFLAVGGDFAQVLDGTGTLLHEHRHGGDRKREGGGKGDSWVSALSWSPDGERLALTGGWTGVCEVWNPWKDLKLSLLRPHCCPTLDLSWSPDGRLIASSCQFSAVFLWDPETGKRVLAYQGHREQVNCVSWSPDGSLLASGSTDRTVQVWNLDGETLQVGKGHLGIVKTLSWSPDGKRLVSGGFDGLLRLWDAPLEQAQPLKMGRRRRIA